MGQSCCVARWTVTKLDKDNIQSSRITTSFQIPPGALNISNILLVKMSERDKFELSSISEMIDLATTRTHAFRVFTEFETAFLS